MTVKRFDPDQALEAALQLFWSRGYHQASAEELVAAMGINRGSWYATFGSKADLYRLALDRYCRADLDRWREELERPEPIVQVLRAVLQRNAKALVADPSGRGCMLANAAADMRPGTVGAEQVRAALHELHELLERALERARTRGELPPGADPQALAAFLLTAIQGLRVVGKADPDPELLTSAIDSALAILPGSTAAAAEGHGPEARTPSRPPLSRGPRTASPEQRGVSRPTQPG